MRFERIIQTKSWGTTMVEGAAGESDSADCCALPMELGHDSRVANRVGDLVDISFQPPAVQANRISIDAVSDRSNIPAVMLLHPFSIVSSGAVGSKCLLTSWPVRRRTRWIVCACRAVTSSVTMLRLGLARRLGAVRQCKAS
jgi:hypothetical protein